MDCITAICDRKSIRAYTSKIVERALIEKILMSARFAPSGVNTQPWKVTVVKGAIKASISQAFINAREQGLPPNPDYNYYPTEWFEPYKSRRYACGHALYSAVGIKKEDLAQRKIQWFKNYEFFGAPVGLFFFLDKRMDKGSWLDMGMFIQNTMLAARHFGLETCPQAALAEYPDIVREKLQIGKQWIVVCGMALGYIDSTHPINQYRTDREPLASFCDWQGW